MKRDTITHSEPRITIELSLSEMKMLRDIFGVTSAEEVERLLREEGMYVHPNFQEQMLRAYKFFYDSVTKMVEVVSNKMER